MALVTWSKMAQPEKASDRLAKPWLWLLVFVFIVMAALLTISLLPRPHYHTIRIGCRNQLKEIDTAKAKWAVQNKRSDSDQPTDADLFGPDREIKWKPTCPMGGVYKLGRVNEKATCSIAEHN